MLLERHAGYEIVAECEDGAQAVATIAAERPDVVFLDIRMPELTGIEVAEALDAARAAGDRAPAVVFVTAYEEYARRAFDVHALDYLLKPVDRERLARALERVEARVAAAAPEPGVDPSLRAFLETLRAERAYPARFLVRDAKGGLYFVRADEIDWVDAQGNYVRLHAGGRAHLVRDTMKAIEAKLNPASFVRVHRSAIVNLDRVQRLEPYSHGEYVLTLRDGTRLRTSRAHSGRLQALLR
jgi:two-component system LytT family response regulator